MSDRATKVKASGNGLVPDKLALESTQSNIGTLGTSTGVTIGTTSTTIIIANANRKEILIVNDSNEDIYLKLGTGATLNSGIRLNANGGSLIDGQRDVYTGIITGICASGNKNVTVTEKV